MSESEKIEMDFDRYFACDLVGLHVVSLRTTTFEFGAQAFFGMTNYTTCGAAMAVTTHSRLSTQDSGPLLYRGGLAVG